MKPSGRYRIFKWIKAVIFTILILLAGAALSQSSLLTPLSTSIQSPVAEVIELKPMTLDKAQSVVSFEIPQPTYLPQGLILQGARAQAPDWAQVFYKSSDGEEPGFGYEVSLGSRIASYVYPVSAMEVVSVAGESGICIQSAKNEFGEWVSKADVTALQWSALNLNFHISQSGLGLNCLDLIKIAESFNVQ